MKIGYVLKKFPRLSETFILNELLALEAQGHEVEIFSLRAPDDEPRHEGLSQLKAAVTVVRPQAPKSIFQYMDTLAKQLPATQGRLEDIVSRLDFQDRWRLEALNFAEIIAPIVKDHRLDHLHAHFATSAAATAEEVSRRTGVPFSFTMHAKDIYRDTVDFQVLSNRIVNASFAVTVCEANKEWLKANCTQKAFEKIRVLYNGIDLRRFPCDKGEREDLFLGVGRFVEKKGFDILLKACGILREKGHRFRAVLAGDGELEEKLRGLRKHLQLEETVEMPGAVRQGEIQALLAKARVLVAPCIKGDDGNQDALPTVMLEALATGTPCIGTPVGGIPEIIRDGSEGWIVPERSAERLAEAMEEALLNADRSRRLGEAGRQRAEELFDLRNNASVLASWFAGARAEVNSPAAQAP